ncbi:MAG: hypothetical protein JWQ38_1999 [Flavipsychrobacter sp.]|nr:hypothetical protein [Flavipsychrobacter sp.]
MAFIVTWLPPFGKPRGYKSEVPGIDGQLFTCVKLRELLPVFSALRQAQGDSWRITHFRFSESYFRFFPVGGMNTEAGLLCISG